MCLSANIHVSMHPSQTITKWTKNLWALNPMNTSYKAYMYLFTAVLASLPHIKQQERYAGLTRRWSLAIMKKRNHYVC